MCGWALLLFPHGLTGFDGYAPHRSDLFGSGSELLNHVEAIDLGWITLVRCGCGHLTQILQREVHHIRQGAVGACRPVLAARAAGTNKVRFVDAGKRHFFVHRDFTG